MGTQIQKSSLRHRATHTPLQSVLAPPRILLDFPLPQYSEGGPGWGLSLASYLNPHFAIEAEPPPQPSPSVLREGESDATSSGKSLETARCSNVPEVVTP
jgi:hypothetical protein